MGKRILITTLLGFTWLNLAVTESKTTTVKPIEPVKQVKANGINISHAFRIIASVESGFDPDTVNRRENAVGILQIRPIMLNEVNRILGREVYTDSCRFSPDKSFEMFKIIIRHYKPKNYYQVAMLWNCGTLTPSGDQGKKYWKKVRRELMKY